MHRIPIKLYFDYKSPFAYLAKDEAYRLEEEYRVQIEWLPYVLDIPAALGDVPTRTTLQWRKVRYAYLDARRWANKRGLLLRGPQKIFDSSLASIGMLYAQHQGRFRPYHDRIYERFWRRELDIENVQAIAAIIDEVGADPPGFLRYVEDGGRDDLAVIQRQADADEIFGVPTFIVEREMFWGHDRVAVLEEKLQAMGVRQ
jgi:2-hydroxychromene-2-carboxylate isomerase